VPSNYVMAFEDKVTSLPWLAIHPVKCLLLVISTLVVIF